MIDSEEKARNKVNETWNAKELFIVLSESQYQNGKSVPRAFQIGQGNISLSIFTTYSAAVAFCKAESYIKEGRCLVGRIDNQDKLRDLYSILNTAVYLGINRTDIDCGTEDAMNIQLDAMFEWGGRKVDSISVLMPEEQWNRGNSTGEFQLRFNEMPLYEEQN